MPGCHDWAPFRFWKGFQGSHAEARELELLVSMQVSKLGEPRAGDDVAVSALAFSPLGNILAVGHANGDIAFWELRRAGWECGKLVKGQWSLFIISRGQ